MVELETLVDNAQTRGDFRVAFPLCFKASPSAKPFKVMKIRFIHLQILVHLQALMPCLHETHLREVNAFSL